MELSLFAYIYIYVVGTFKHALINNLNTYHMLIN